jgi:hypothetical protein
VKLEDFFRGAAGGCQAPGCTHPHGEVVMHARCHPDAATFVTVDAKKRTIKITCADCDKLIANVECPFVN